MGSIVLKIELKTPTAKKKFKIKQILWPPPLFLMTISLVEIITFFYPLKEALQFLPQKKNQVWRFFSYVLVHEDWTHIVPNVTLQLVLGWLLEKKANGWLKVGGLYFGSTVFGASTSFFTRRGIVGASAATYSLATAGLTSFILIGDDEWEETPKRYFIIGYLVVLIGLIAENVYSVANRESVALMAHGIGAAVGVLFAMILFNNNEKAQYLKWTAGGLLILSFTVLIVLNFIGS